jgi:hypothetical protein
MTQRPQWTAQEFEVLLDGGSMGVSELTRLLPGRSAGAVDMVQQGIHGYHLSDITWGIPPLD